MELHLCIRKGRLLKHRWSFQYLIQRLHSHWISLLPQIWYGAIHRDVMVVSI